MAACAPLDSPSHSQPPNITIEKEINETLTKGIKEEMRFAEKCTEFVGGDLMIFYN